MSEDESPNAADKALRAELERSYGLIMNSQQIRQLLAFPSQEAFRQARHKGAIGIRMFPQPHRRGLFALTRDVAHWVSEQRGRAAKRP